MTIRAFLAALRKSGLRFEIRESLAIRTVTNHNCPIDALSRARGVCVGGPYSNAAKLGLSRVDVDRIVDAADQPQTKDRKLRRSLEELTRRNPA